MNFKVLLSILLLFIVCLFSFFPAFITSHSPDFQNPFSFAELPNPEHWLGTDSLGRDLLSRLFEGGKISLSVAFFTAISGFILGTLYGSVAALSGGIIDTVLMYLLDLFYTLPTLLVLIFLNVLFSEPLTGILFALSLEGMMSIARLTRAEVLKIKTLDFIAASKVIGLSRFKIYTKHIFPHFFTRVLVLLTFLIPSNIMYEAFISFIGLGIQAPKSSWGTLANEGWRAMHSHPHLILFPAIFIFLTMLALHCLGNYLQKAIGLNQDVKCSAL